VKASIPFDRAASFYDETRAFAPGVAEKAAAAITEAAALGSSSHILEIGIGTGRVALPLANHTDARVTGVDLAVPMLDVLRGKRTDEDIHVVRGDVSRLPLPSGAFDAVVAAHIFHLVGDPAATLREVARALKPGAPLVFTYIASDGDPLLEIFWSGRKHSKHRRFRNADFLDESGWQPAGDPVTVPYEIEITPAGRIESMQNRIWSSTWSMTDDEIAARVGEMRAACAEHDIPLDEPLTRQMTFTAAPYTPPA